MRLSDMIEDFIKDLFDEETAKLAKKLPPRIDMYHK